MSDCRCIRCTFVGKASGMSWGTPSPRAPVPFVCSRRLFLFFFSKQAEDVQAMSVFIINVFSWPCLVGTLPHQNLGHTERLFIPSLDM